MNLSMILPGLIVLTFACAPGPEGGQPAPAGSTAKENQAMPQVTLTLNEPAQQVDVTVDGQPFTSYCYWDKQYKPVLYPLRTADGRTVSRGYPVKMVTGERVDHPHQVSCWFNFGDVNGVDFWGNSDSVNHSRGRFGQIRHKSLDGMQSGPGKGWIDVTLDWLGPSDDLMLTEKDRIYFRAAPGLRIIDRVMTLTAAQKIVFNDTKEGAFAIRVTRGLEEPSTEPIRYVDASGEVTEVAALDNTGVEGSYLSSEGKVDEKGVWGTRAKWCILRGTVEGRGATIAIFDYPDNVGYPTHWHARGYGLFSANMFGFKAFNKNETELNFTLQPGESTTLRYRVLIATDKLDAEMTERLYQEWLKDNQS